MKYQVILMTLSSAVLLLFFQNCGQKIQSSTAEFINKNGSEYTNKYGQTTEQNSQQDQFSEDLPADLTQPVQLPTPGPTQLPAPMPVPTPGAGLIPAPSPAPAPQPAPTAGFDCNQDLEKLGWVGLNNKEKVQIHLYTTDNDAITKTPFENEVLAHDGIDVRFENPYRLGSQEYGRYSPNFFADGYTIKVTDNASGASVTPVESDLDYHYQGGNLDRAVNTFVTGAKSAINEYNRITNNSVRHLLNRNFYEKIKNFKTSTVSLYCKNNLVASGIQDVNSLTYIMSRKMYKKTTTQSSYYAFPTTDGFSYLDCPYEINAGSSSKCELLGNNIANGYWVVNGQKGQQYNTSAYKYELNLSALTRGEHKVQFFLNYKNGSGDVSQIYLVKVK